MVPTAAFLLRASASAACAGGRSEGTRPRQTASRAFGRTTCSARPSTVSIPPSAESRCDERSRAVDTQHFGPCSLLRKEQQDPRRRVNRARNGTKRNLILVTDR